MSLYHTGFWEML